MGATAAVSFIFNLSSAAEKQTGNTGWLACCDVLIQDREITHPDVALLLRRAEEELLELYPDMPPLPVNPLARFVVAYVMGRPVGCGGLVPVEDGTVEITRMFVLAGHRRTGVARRILAGLIRRASDGHSRMVIVETGTKQDAAIALFEGSGFERTEPYGKYVFVRRL